MPRQRTGGSGKYGTLSQQFNYYKRQMFNRLIEEEAFERAMGGGGDITPSNLFKQINYQKVFSEGITRKIGNKTIRLKGEEAVRVQIGSLRRRASKTEQALQYIQNYMEPLKQLKMPELYLTRIYNRLLRTSTDKLTYLIRKGILKQIAFYYQDERTWKDIYKEIIDAIDYGVSKETLADIRAKKKQIKPYVKGIFQTMYQW